MFGLGEGRSVNCSSTLKIDSALDFRCFDIYCPAMIPPKMCLVYMYKMSQIEELAVHAILNPNSRRKAITKKNEDCVCMLKVNQILGTTGKVGPNSPFTPILYQHNFSGFTFEFDKFMAGMV